MHALFLAPLAALAFLHSSAHQKKSAADQAYELGRWRLDVHKDAFRQQVHCRIADDYGHFPRVLSTRGALVLRLPGHADGAEAWFSIDGAPAVPWRNIEATLIANGAMAAAESLDNATNGELLFPYAAISHAHSLVVQVPRKKNTLKYNLIGLWPTIQAARQLGCDL